MSATAKAPPPGVAVQVQLQPESAAGNTSLTLAPLTVPPPTFVTTMVYVSVVPALTVVRLSVFAIARSVSRSLQIPSRSVSPVDSAMNQQLRDQIERVLDSLDGREERVIRLRFGLDDGRQRTLEEVGHEFGLTRERIRQIESMALRKLRHPSRSRKLREFATE